MKAGTARAVTDALLVSAGIAAACVVLTRPSLRRRALKVLRLWLGASVPLYLASEAKHAWVESGRAA